jgi:hypothetical protein
LVGICSRVGIGSSRLCRRGGFEPGLDFVGLDGKGAVEFLTQGEPERAAIALALALNEVLGNQFFDVGDAGHLSLQRIRYDRLSQFIKRHQIPYHSVDLSEHDAVMQLFRSIKQISPALLDITV